MTSYRRFTPSIGISMALVVLVPASAQAGSLLSGYGGPGQGSQAILGSTIVNGGGGGGPRGAGAAGGSHPASSQGSGEGSPSSASASILAVKSGGGGPPAGGGSAGTHVRTGGGKGARATRAAGGSRPRPAPLNTDSAAGGASDLAAAAYTASQRAASPGSSGTFGLSGDDLLVGLLVLGAILFTGVLTWRLGVQLRAGQGKQAGVGG
jgi:hypothetical protein